VSAAAVRALLARHGLVARRDLGQNFLVDEHQAARLVELAGVGPDDAVLEIGTGLGILTRALAARARRVVSIEVDAGVVRALRAEALLPEGVELVHGDALSLDLDQRLRALGAPVRVVANLPYALSAPLLRMLLDLREQLVDWSVMLQRDVASRMLARPGSKDYGSLAVLHALTVDLSMATRLSPRCFFPVPKVDSAFVRAVPRAVASLRPGELAAVERVVRAAFGQRRKTLANALLGAGVHPAGEEAPAALLERLGHDPRVRAEQLTPEALLELSRALAGDAG
jgi:16S rRNA (adenine1518-N6/adenine1519-N6)-dimethyltransferase